MAVYRLPIQCGYGRGATQESAESRPAFPRSTGRVYAISFDLDVLRLEQHHPAHNRTSAYDDIRRVLERRGFSNVQGSLYFGKDGTNSVDCVLAAQAVSERYPWFKFVVRDIRMLRVEEDNDLMRAVNPQAALPLEPTG